MIIDFPYENVKNLLVPDCYFLEILDLPHIDRQSDELEIVKFALHNPIGAPSLYNLGQKISRVLIVVDDNTRPTPVYLFIHLILKELEKAGVKNENISFLIALGTHRYMSSEEQIEKLGKDVVGKYEVYNHDWRDTKNLDYLGVTEQSAPVWINKKVHEADLVIGVGAIMPIDVCGFTGGGKIIVPGLSGELTVDEMHWTRVNVKSDRVLGLRDNPIRNSIDALARKAGLNFIVNVIVDSENKIVGAVSGDMVEAHKKGCIKAMDIFGVKVNKRYDIVIADSYPFDIEFWQANKGLDTAGEIVKENGVIILVSPCVEGLSITHGDQIRKYGYPSHAEIKKIVQEKRINKVVGVHMHQVRAALRENVRFIMVSSGLKEKEVTKLGFFWARDVQEAFKKSLELVPKDPVIAVLRNAPRMLIIKD